MVEGLSGVFGVAPVTNDHRFSGHVSSHTNCAAFTIEYLLKVVILIVRIGPLPGLEVQYVLKDERYFEVLWEARNKCVGEVV